MSGVVVVLRQPAYITRNGGAAVALTQRVLRVVSHAQQGPAGPPGASGGGFNFTQAISATSWTINHNLGFRPIAELFSVGGMAIDADVVHTSVNQCIAYFTIALAGSARLS